MKCIQEKPVKIFPKKKYVFQENKGKIGWSKPSKKTLKPVFVTASQPTSKFLFSFYFLELLQSYAKKILFDLLHSLFSETVQIILFLDRNGQLEPNQKLMQTVGSLWVFLKTSEG